MVAAPAVANGVPEPFPGSTVESRQQDPAGPSRDVLLSSVERVRGELRADRMVSGHGAREVTVWRMPPRTALDDVIDHFRIRMSGDSVTRFECRGRDCGRNTVWVNDIFRTPGLSGPDGAQHYIGAVYTRGTDSLAVSVYVIQRGNRNIYARIESLAGVDIGDIDRALGLSVSDSGEYLRIEALDVSADGTVRVQDPVALAMLVRQAQALASRSPIVVCHLHGGAAIDELMARSTACAEAAAGELARAGLPGLRGFGAGPLVPGRAGGTLRWLELVVPAAATTP